MVKSIAKRAGFNLLALIVFAVVGLLAGIFMLYGLPLLETWYGWVGATVIIGILVVAFDMDDH